MRILRYDVRFKDFHAHIWTHHVNANRTSIFFSNSKIRHFQPFFQRILRNVGHENLFSHFCDRLTFLSIFISISISPISKRIFLAHFDNFEFFRKFCDFSRKKSNFFDIFFWNFFMSKSHSKSIYNSNKTTATFQRQVFREKSAKLIFGKFWSRSTLTHNRENRKFWSKNQLCEFDSETCNSSKQVGLTAK